MMTKYASIMLFFELKIQYFFRLGEREQSYEGNNKGLFKVEGGSDTESKGREDSKKESMVSSTLVKTTEKSHKMEG